MYWPQWGSLCSLSVVLVGVAAWWLAGRSIRPAQQAWARQQQFIANASHELRTPLTLIRATVEVTQRSLPSTDAEPRALLDDVIAECQHMSQLVEDLLLLSRLDAAQQIFNREPVLVRDVLVDVSWQMQPLAAQRELTLEVGAANGAVLADPARLRQVLLTLLDNSLRYTPAGGQIRVWGEPHGKNIALNVADTGAGIPSEHLPHIFERFYQVDSARGASSNSGLGLSIARELIEQQQGTIAISSTEGQGTTITIRLPATSAA